MSAMLVEPALRFCHVHGYAHPDGEMDSVRTAPDNRHCHEEEWPAVVSLDSDEFTIEEEVQTVNSETTPFFTIKAGDLAYIYTVRGGVVPCKVLTVKDDGETHVRITADRLGWRRGTVEVLGCPAVSLVHRSQVSHSRGMIRVHGSVAIVTDKGNLIR